MLRIRCPWCGPRAQVEFDWGGESRIVRPDPERASDAEWARYLYFRRNTKGPEAERWRHTHGCRQWFEVIRDTLTHEIMATQRFDEPAAPAAAPGRSAVG